MKAYYLLIVLFCSVFSAVAQESEETADQPVDVVAQETIEQSDSEPKELKLISIAGQTIDMESGDALGGVKIINETRNQTIASKVSGYYSIVAAPGDIIRFSHIGYEPEYMRINDFDGTKTFVKIHLTEDAYFIEEVIVGELPSESELNDYFMSVDVGDDISREIVEANPETFKILDNIKEPPPGGPVSFLKKHVFDNIKKKKKKPGRSNKLPKYKE